MKLKTLFLIWTASLPATTASLFPADTIAGPHAITLENLWEDTPITKGLHHV